MARKPPRAHPRTIRRVIAYTRVSEEGGRVDLQSPEIQLGKIVAEIERRGWTLAGEPMYEGDVSGGDFTRTELNRAIEMIENDDADAICVYMLSRWVRSYSAAVLEERIERAGGHLVSVFEPAADGQTTNGRFIRGMINQVNAYQKELNAEHRNNAREKAIRSHLHLGAVPLGYRRPYLDGSYLTRAQDAELRELPEEQRLEARAARGKVAGPLEPDPDTAPIVVGMFERTAGGASRRSVARWATDSGVPISFAHVPRLLKNRTYLGEVRHGAYVESAAHEPLVSELLFRRAQRNGARFRNDATPTLLSGLVHCAGCRATMQRATNGKGHRRYQCPHLNAVKAFCSSPSSIAASAIEPYVDELMVDYLRGLHLRAQDDGGRAELRRLDAQIDAKGEEISDWKRPKTRRAVGEEDWYAGIAELEEERRDLVAQRDQREAELGVNDSLRELEAAENYLTRPAAGRRRLLGLAIDVVFVASATSTGRATAEVLRRRTVERTHVVWRPHGRAIDLPRPGHAFNWRPFVFPDDAEATTGVVLGE